MSAAENKAVFLSYASQDADAARRICDALRAAGVEVWFDQSELRGGDSWDAKIRKQIAACTLFVPVISAATQARREGYFRLEWRLAAQRTHMMSEQVAFLLPVVIDATRDADADVPAEFKTVQWTRLPGGETPAAFCVRVKNLLGGSSGTGVPPVAEELHRGRGTRATTEPRRLGGRWLIPAMIGVAGCAVLAIWQPWKTRSLPAQATGTSTAPLSAARQLTLKARALIDDDLMAVRENFRLADELCQQAVGLDSTDGEAWATWARVSAEMIQKQYDRTPQRTEAARRQAERAIRLAPQSIEAGLAMAAYFAVTRETVEAERWLRDLLNQAPKDARVALALAQVLDALGRAAEASDLRLKHPAFAENDARPLLQEANALLGTGRFVEAESLVDRVHAQAPTWASYRAKLRFAGVIWGDLEAAKQILDQAPPVFLLEGGPALSAAQIWLWRREPEKALEVLRRIAGDFFEGDNAMRPKGFYAGWAHQLGGRSTAAQAEWRQALGAVVRRLTTEPNDALLLNHQALLLALTGQKEEATKVRRLHVELGGNRFGLRPSGVAVPVEAQRQARALLEARHEAAFLLAVDNREDAVRVLQAVEMPRSGRAVHLNNIRYDPWFEPIRNDPRIQKIIAEGEAWLNELRRATTPAGAKSAVTAGSSPDAKSVAVLAFDNLSDDKANEYFSDGISEELLDAIGKVPGLRVAGRTSSFSFKGKNVPEPEIARQLGVTHNVRGSVSRSGADVPIRARRVSAADGLQLWSDKFTRDAKDVFALQDEIAGRVARELQLKLGASRAARAVNPEAYSLVLEGRHFWNLRGADPENLTRAEQAFQGALKIDPAFPQALAGLADVYVIQAWWVQMEGQPSKAALNLARARQRAMEALGLDDSLPEPHAALGTVHFLEGGFAEAENSFARAFQNNRSHAVARHWHSVVQGMKGRLDIALEQSRESALADPRSPNSLWSLATIYNYAGRHEEAATAVERSLVLRPGFLPALAEKAVACWFVGRKEDAVAAARVIARDRTSTIRWWADAAAILVLRLAGHAAEAEEVAAHIQKTAPSNDYRRGFALAALGRLEEAYALTADVPTTAWGCIFYHRMWDQGRADPRFLQMVERLGCGEQYKAARASVQRLAESAKQ